MCSMKIIRITTQCCNAVQSFWPVELEELADGSTGYDEMARFESFICMELQCGEVK